MARTSSVLRTVDFSRIEALPRRKLDVREAEDAARFLTKLFAEPGADVALRAWQGQAIFECVEYRHLCGGLPVGQGKTLITWLLPLALGAKRPVLILPASLIDKTRADFRSYLGKWRRPAVPPRLITREELALDKNADLLDCINPDLVMVDESDELANPIAGATNRIDRFRVSHQDKAKCVFATMSGTLIRLSILGNWHLLCWSLLEDAPVPLSHTEAKVWAAAIDEAIREPGRRPHPGVLGPTIPAAREWYRRRLIETPGVIIVDEDSAADIPLTIRTRLSREDPTLDRHYSEFLRRFRNPGGIEVTDPLSRWTLDALMGCGLYNYYDPEPPIEWRLARRAEAKFVRDRILRTRRSRRPVDTEKQVLNRYRDDPVVVEWLRQKPTFDPRKATRFKWFSDSTLQSALDWLAESPEPGVVWCGSKEFGKRLAAKARLPYYGSKGRTQGGGGLHCADTSRSLVASWPANKRGFNLQPWRRALIVLPPQSAKFLEQIIGRHHRAGQDREVVVDILLTSGGTIDAFEAALKEARFSKQVTSLTQKVLRAKIVRAKPRLTEQNKYRWASRRAA